ncbi:MAG: GH3 auxin-responsive promoter family protein, partial [Candidatus Hodarchaeota archaeon]
GYATRLTSLLGTQVDYRESYGATEPGLIAYQADSDPGMVPVLGNNFFEFIPLTEWRTMELEGGDYHNFDLTCHTLQDVKPGTEYVIALTTVGGMYRYIIGDTVVFRQADIPRFNWSGRLTWYSNIALERMNFGHVEQTMQLLSEHLACTIANFSYATTYDPPRYHFIIEPEGLTGYAGDIATLVDQFLMEVNAEYHFCRERRLLLKPEVSIAPYGTYGLLERLWIEEKGARIGQYKPPRYTTSEIIQQINAIVYTQR